MKENNLIEPEINEPFCEQCSSRKLRFIFESGPKSTAQSGESRRSLYIANSDLVNLDGHVQFNPYGP